MTDPLRSPAPADASELSRLDRLVRLRNTRSADLTDDDLVWWLQQGSAMMPSWALSEAADRIANTRATSTSAVEGMTADEAEAMGDMLSNRAMTMRYGSWPQREGLAGPVFDSFGQDAFSWNIHGEDDDPDDPDDGSGRPGVSMVGGAISVWSGLQRGRPSVATVAAIFNIRPTMVREAVEHQPYLFLSPSGGADDPHTFIEADGE